jgi:Na+-transporting NADH:ubiquinone oxidoreductase subunit C
VNLKAENKIKDVTKRKYPLFIYKNEDGRENYIIPMRGSGLWDAIWGFIAINDDFNTVVGVSFDHAAETPGLGDKIKNTEFKQQFIGKTIMDNGNYVGIEVKKGVLKKPDHQVEALTGATITSVGVSDMVIKDVKYYLPYFNSLKKS